jgi:hypothetical protein
MHCPCCCTHFIVSLVCRHLRPPRRGQKQKKKSKLKGREALFLIIFMHHFFPFIIPAKPTLQFRILKQKDYKYIHEYDDSESRKVTA